MFLKVKANRLYIHIHNTRLWNHYKRWIFSLVQFDPACSGLSTRVPKWWMNVTYLLNGFSPGAMLLFYMFQQFFHMGKSQHVVYRIVSYPGYAVNASHYHILDVPWFSTAPQVKLKRRPLDFSMFHTFLQQRFFAVPSVGWQSSIAATKPNTPFVRESMNAVARRFGWGT